MSRPSPAPAAYLDLPKPVFEGDLSVFSLIDVIQLVCVIHGVHRVVVLDEGREMGRMLVAAAEVVSARSRFQEGDDAFVELSRLPHGRVVAYPTTYEAEAELPRLARSWQELAMEAARLEDEERRDSVVEDEPAPVTAPAVLTASEDVPAPAPHADPPERSFSELSRDALSAYVHRDYATAIALFDQCLALRPDDRTVRHNLERLAKFRRQP